MTPFTLALPGGPVRAAEWPGPADAPTLVFAHATGMCLDVYGELLAALAERVRVVAFDARGHGGTRLPADPAAPPPDWADWECAATDLLDVAAALRLDPARTVLAGHSFGGSCALQAAARLCAAGTPPLAACAIEPAFIPFALADGYRQLRDSSSQPPNPMADRAAKRSGAFPSRAAMRAAYAGRGVFADWPPAALDAYVMGGATEDADGARLACAPAWEAATFRAVTTRLESATRALTCPALLIHGTEGSTVQPEDAATMATTGLAVIKLDGAGHFAPVTETQRVLAAMASMPIA